VPLGSVAATLHRDGRLPESYAAYARALCAEPSDLALARQLVEVWVELGAAGDVQAVLQGCAITPASAAYLKGLVAAVRGDVQTSLTSLDQALQALQGPERVEVLYRKGLVLLGGGRFAEAEVALGEAAGLAPVRADLRLALAQSLLGQDRVAEAAALVRGIMILAPNAAEVNRARKLLRTIVAKSEAPLDANVEMTLKELLTSLSRGNPTSEEFVRIEALRQEVAHPRVLTTAGLAALNRGLMREALRYFEEAAELAPLDAEPWRALGNGLVAAHRELEAQKALLEAHARDPFDAETTRLLAQVAVSANDVSLARDMYQALCILQPSDTDALLWLTRLERRLGHWPAAEQAVRQGLLRAPKDVPLLGEAAAIAIERLERAKTNADAEPEAARLLGREVLAALSEIAPNHPMVAGLTQALGQ